MPRQGRALEQLVAELERVLGPTDVVIQSPEYILGRITGDIREVDVTLRSKIGSSDVLVMIECRDRKGRQGIPWIEQVESKKEDVGADKAVAVCPGGFTGGARKLADAKQIDLRTIASVTGPEVFGWLGLETVNVRNWNIEYRAIRFGVAEGRLELAPETSEALSSGASHLAPVLVRRTDGHVVSVHDVWKTVDKDRAFAEFEFEPDKQYEVSCAIAFRGDPLPYKIRTVDGLVDLTGLEVGGLLSYTEVDLPISRFYEYTNESGALVHTAEVDVEHEGARIVVGVNVTPDRTRHSVTVRRDQDSGPDVIQLRVSAEYEAIDPSQ